MKKILVIIFVIATSCCLKESRTSCDITIMSWNLQNLFDGVDDGDEYDDFSVAKGNWSETLYKKRLKSISKIISLNNPDIVGVQEIEGKSVLLDLQKGFLEDYKYIVASGDYGAIETGFLSKYPIIKVGKIVPSIGVYGVRTLLEIHVDINGNEIVLINNHWKSKRGDFSENLRIDSSNALGKRLSELKNSEVIVLGDLNENYDEYKRVGKSYDTALMYKEVGKGLTITDSSRIDDSELYTPWPDAEALGSYFYNGEWESIDHFLLNKRLMDKEDYYFDNFYVDERALLFDSKGYIKKWNTDFSTGYSDHLPIILKLNFDSLETTLE